MNTEEKFCVVCGKLIEKKPYYKSDGTFCGYGAYATKKTCSRSCTNVYRAGIDLEQRFWDRVDTSGGDDACWPWTLSTNDQGYGRMGWGSKLELTHRIAWALGYNAGVFPDENVLHTCDNPPCCNPAHLFIGTQDDNMQDTVSKGRASRKYGNLNGRAKLTEDQVREIRALYAAGTHSQSELSSMFGIHQTRVSAIVNRKQWPHI